MGMASCSSALQGRPPLRARGAGEYGEVSRERWSPRRGSRSRRAPLGLCLSLRCLLPMPQGWPQAVSLPCHLPGQSIHAFWIANIPHILRDAKGRGRSLCRHEFSDREPHLWPQDPDDDRSQLLVLASELSHLVKASLKLSVSRVDPPHHLEVFFPFPFDNVSQQYLEFLVFIIPSLKNFKARDHNLGYNLRGEAYY